MYTHAGTHTHTHTHTHAHRCSHLLRGRCVLADGRRGWHVCVCVCVCVCVHRTVAVAVVYLLRLCQSLSSICHSTCVWWTNMRLSCRLAALQPHKPGELQSARLLKHVAHAALVRSRQGTGVWACAPVICSQVTAYNTCVSRMFLCACACVCVCVCVCVYRSGGVAAGLQGAEQPARSDDVTQVYTHSIFRQQSTRASVSSVCGTACLYWLT